MNENPSPTQPSACTSAKQVVHSSADDELVHTSTQWQNNERNSDTAANADNANGYEDVYYSSIPELADDSNTTSLSVDRRLAFIQIVATRRIRQVRLAMLI